MKIFSTSVKVLLAILLILGGIGIYFYLHHGEVSTDSGTIDGRTVVISPKVSGYVKALPVQDNQQVKAGDILLEIDPTDYIIRRDRASSALDAARAASIRPPFSPTWMPTTFSPSYYSYQVLLLCLCPITSRQRKVIRKEVDRRFHRLKQLLS